MLAVRMGEAFTSGAVGALPEGCLSGKTVLSVASRREEMPAETRGHLAGH